ncbi:peptide chain release factor N(5)-glutamine methyltransferase [Pediococcus siamensis]|uniref:peptide chain release factor N(5)-glutamine methyltransferase n=1 Tax=Pediococcus siamensis TaxID=381829 RepID=UPI0039A1F814
MNNPTYLEALNWAFLYIKPFAKAGIDENGVKLLLADMCHWNNTQLILHYRAQMDATLWQQFQENVHRYAAGEPVQYITQQATFFGTELYVDARVLIPRFETEELVEWVLQDQDETPKTVLDLGTGSGAIAIALQKQRPKWTVIGSDISAAALQVAQKNARASQLPVKFEESDLFNAFQDRTFDVIVSNPPYIARSEAKVMDRSVLEHEPDQALFAPEQGLAIYRRLSQQLPQYLKPAGALYCEFGYHQKAALQELFMDTRYQVTFKKDVTEHDRMLRVKVKREGKL